MRVFLTNILDKVISVAAHPETIKQVSVEKHQFYNKTKELF